VAAASFPRLFFVPLAFMLAALVLQLWMMYRVSKAGMRIVWFTVGPDMLKWIRDYRSLARERQWPMWPISMFWTLFTIGMILLISLGLTLK
jgi:hypothetical protein